MSEADTSFFSLSSVVSLFLSFSFCSFFLVSEGRSHLGWTEGVKCDCHLVAAAVLYRLNFKVQCVKFPVIDAFLLLTSLHTAHKYMNEREPWQSSETHCETGVP